jgi:hypothetical protein
VEDNEKIYGLEAAREAAKKGQRAPIVTKEGVVYYSVQPNITGANESGYESRDGQSVSPEAVILFDLGPAGDRIYDASDHNRTSGQQGQTNQQALLSTVDQYVKAALAGDAKVVYFVGGASTDGHDTGYDNQGLAEDRAEQVERAFSRTLTAYLADLQEQGGITAVQAREILDHYNAVDDAGVRINTVNLGSVYRYKPGEKMDPKDRRGEIYLTSPDGAKDVLETRYVYVLDQEKFYAKPGESVTFFSKSGVEGLPRDAYARLNDDMVVRTGLTDVVLDNISMSGRSVPITFAADDNTAALKYRFAIATDTPEAVTFEKNYQTNSIQVLYHGKEIAEITVKGGASIDFIRIGTVDKDSNFHSRSEVLESKVNALAISDLDAFRVVRDALDMTSGNKAYSMDERKAIMEATHWFTGDADGLTKAELEVIKKAGAVFAKTDMSFEDATKTISDIEAQAGIGNMAAKDSDIIR